MLRTSEDPLALVTRCFADELMRKYGEEGAKNRWPYDLRYVLDRHNVRQRAMYDGENHEERRNISCTCCFREICGHAQTTFIYGLSAFMVRSVRCLSGGQTRAG